MPRATRPSNDEYIEVGYEDKVVFTSEEQAKGHGDILSTWQSSQGLWADHPVFGGMEIKEVIEWLRGEDCDV